MFNNYSQIFTIFINYLKKEGVCESKYDSWELTLDVGVV